MPHSTTVHLASSEVEEDLAYAMARNSIDRWPDATAAATDQANGDSSVDLAEFETLLEVTRLGDADAETSILGLRLGRFTLLEELGRGGFGIVYRAFDPALEREIALKIPRPERLAAGQYTQLLLEEARHVARLDHPGIVRVYEVGALGPAWYVATAYCEGPTLAEWLETRTPLTPALAASLVAQIGRAVHHAHMRGVLHLDLKPANILLAASKEDPATLEVLVTDFGLARRSDGPNDSACVGGTKAYMAPEQCAGDVAQLGVATDVYALGAILQEMLAVGRGRRDDVRARRESRRERMQRADLAAIVAKCLARHPDDRYGSARELVEDLVRLMHGEVIAARPLSRAARTFRWIERRPAVALQAALVATTLVTAAGLVVFQWRRAETGLQRLGEEQLISAAVNRRMETTLLNLAAIAQEASLRRSTALVDERSATRLVANFHAQLEACLNAPGNGSATAAMAAASHSLSMVGQFSREDRQRLESEFVAGVHGWLRLVEAQPHAEQWRQALALHLLAYTYHAKHGQWQWWLDGREDLPPASLIRVAVGPAYASLLVELGEHFERVRDLPNAYGALLAANSIVEPVPAPMAAGVRQQVATLKLRDALARIALRLGRDQECSQWLDDAARYVAEFQSRAAQALAAESLVDLDQLRVRLLLRQGDHRGVAAAAEHWQRHAEQLLQLDPACMPVRLSAARAAQRRGQLDRAVSDFPAAAERFQDAARLLSGGLEHAPSCRQLVKRRALMYAAAAECLLAIDRTEQSRTAFEQALQDFQAAELCASDTRTTWIAWARCQQSLARLYQAERRIDDAVVMHRRTLETLERLKTRMANHPTHAALLRSTTKSLNRLVAN